MYVHTPVYESYHSQLQFTPLVGRDSCALLLARGDQLKPSSSVRGAELLSEPAELENGGFRLAPSSSINSALPADRQYRETAGHLQVNLPNEGDVGEFIAFTFCILSFVFCVGFITFEAHCIVSICVNVLYTYKIF